MVLGIRNFLKIFHPLLVVLFLCCGMSSLCFAQVTQTHAKVARVSHHYSHHHASIHHKITYHTTSKHHRSTQKVHPFHQNGKHRLHHAAVTSHKKYIKVDEDNNDDATTADEDQNTDQNFDKSQIKETSLLQASNSHQGDVLPIPTAFRMQSSDENADLSINNANAIPNDQGGSENNSLSTRAHLVALIHKAMSGLHYTSYKFGGSYFDLSRGIYEEDCSGYVDQLLKSAEPNAYASLTQWTHSSKPNSFDYYDFFKRLPSSSWHFWQKVENVAALKPGAILVFRYHGRTHYNSGGHVMVVMSQPIAVENDTNAFLVRVSDSARSGHSNDTRALHTSGVGIGTLLLKVNPFTRQPNAYAWKLSGWLEHVDVAMAEPITPA